MSEETQPQSTPQDELIGKKLGHFTILQEIGRGGMATVYSATQERLGRQVAVKVLPRHFLHDPGFLERFKREVEVISSLSHPHILPIFDYGESDGVPYIAMRYLGGGSMAQMIRRGVPPLEDLEKPFNQVAEALDYAHQQGIIHRDLKPGNIMLDEYGNAYLSDFGIARVMGSDLTGSAVIGTPAYMSPEQANGETIDARSDIYALGIVLFELITGREPYQAETPMSLLLKHINEPIPPLEQFREGVPKAVESVIAKATAKNPDERYSSATEMAKAFSQALRETPATEPRFDPERTVTEDLKPLPNEGGTQVGGTKLGTKVGVGSPEPGTQGQVDVMQPQVQRRRSPLLLGAVLLLVLVVGGGLLLVSGVLDTGATAIPTPTPFPQSSRVVTDNYAISIPLDILPANPVGYIDRSDDERIYHLWRSSEDDSLFVAIALVNARRVSVDDYEERYFSQDSYALIDRTQAPNGMIRHSYRVQDDEELDNGQLDVFFVEEGDFLVVLSMYTADSVATDNLTLTRLQSILNSLRLGEQAN